jgi:His/Glu/Gln/Arg/opine family amino acid ABC transporter permease subunit
MSAKPRPSQNPILAIISNVRVLQWVGQIVFLIIVVALLSLVWSSIVNSLNAKNLAPNFTFLQNRAGFDISNAPDWYSSNSNYWTAFQVGVSNSLRVIVSGLVMTTFLGILMGIFLLSSNWLVRTISRVYVEVLRNTPLLVQLFTWYFIVMLALPSFQQPLTFPSEGILPIPLRFALYVILFIFIRRSVDHLSMTAPRRVFIVTAFYATLIALEAAFRLAFTQPAWAAYYASGNLLEGAFLLYIVISAVLLAAAWFAPQELRWRALGLAVGQLIGGLLFYFGIAPAAAVRLELYPAVYVSVRGFVFPEILATARLAEWLAFVSVGVALAIILWIYFGRLIETTGIQYPRGLYCILAIVIFAAVGWGFSAAEPPPSLVPVEQDGQMVLLPLDDAREQDLLTREDEQLYSTQPFLFVLPEKRGLRFVSGTEIAPEYMALLLGLTVYTSAFIAEIVRAGILAVPRGQLEAARALGLTTVQTLRMIILPQALRVIIPPLGNQYLNLSKNSSLAIAIAFADVVLVTTTIMNQSGQSVTGITMIMIFYLIISLSISVVTNWFNRRFKLVTR